MTRAGASLVFPASVALALVWGTLTVAYSAMTWSTTVAGIAQVRDDGQRFCAGRYGQPDARQRCEDLFDVQYTSDWNSALATRAFFAAAPLIAVGIWAWSRRRSRLQSTGTPTTRRRRK